MRRFLQWKWNAHQRRTSTIGFSGYGDGKSDRASDDRSHDHEIDNQATIPHLESEGSMNSAKHVDTRYFKKKGVARPEYVESRLMMADLLTKALPTSRLMELESVSSLV